MRLTKEGLYHGKSRSLSTEFCRAPTFKDCGIHGDFEEEKEVQNAKRTNVKPLAPKQASLENRRSFQC